MAFYTLNHHKPFTFPNFILFFARKANSYSYKQQGKNISSSAGFLKELSDESLFVFCRVLFYFILLSVGGCSVAIYVHFEHYHIIKYGVDLCRLFIQFK